MILGVPTCTLCAFPETPGWKASTNSSSPIRAPSVRVSWKSVSRNTDSRIFTMPRPTLLIIFTCYTIDMASKSRARHGLPENELRNMAFMAHEFKERHGNLLSEKARYQSQLELRARTEVKVQQARSAVRNNNTLKSNNNRKNKLTRKLKNIDEHLHEPSMREYAMHVHHNTGVVTQVQEPSYANIVVRWTPILKFNDDKAFKQNPKATVMQKTTNGLPSRWTRGDKVTMPEYWIHTSLLDGKNGAWKKPSFMNEGSGVIYNVEMPRNMGGASGVGGGGVAANIIIMGVFKDYSLEMITRYPDLIFCSERFWIENGVLRDI